MAVNPVVASYMDAAEWVPVRSSNVAAVAYVADFAYLFVRFRSGATYLYEQVPGDVYRGLLGAPSKGQYVYYVLRGKGSDGVYPTRRVG